MYDLTERIGTLIWTLGDESSDVARALVLRGIKGFAHTGEHCPIAMLIRREFPETDNDELWGWVSDGEDDPGHPIGFFVDVDQVHTPDGPITCPPGVSDFIAEFDDDEDGDYAAIDAGVDLIGAEIESITAEAARAEQ